MKSMKSILAFMVALAFACSFTCCSNDDDDESSSNGSNIQLSNQNVNDFVEKEFTVLMFANPGSTGYDWVWANKAEAAADSVGFIFDENVVPLDTTAEGVSHSIAMGGIETWTFKTKETGVDSLVFYYVRSFEKNVAPIDTFVFYFGDNIINVSMFANPGSTGYDWIWANKDDAAADSVTFSFNPCTAPDVDGDQSILVGGGGFETWTFRKKSEGADSLVFYYLRSWEKNVAPIDTLVCHF